MSDFSHDALRQFSDALQSTLPAELLTALQQILQLLPAAPNDSALLDGAAFEWIPHLTNLTVYQNPISETTNEIRQLAQQTLRLVARRATSPREAFLALIERLHFSLQDWEVQDHDACESSFQIQLVAVLQALSDVLPRIKSKKPVTFVKQLHEVLVPLLDSAPLVDRPPFCATLVELIQAVRALGPDIIEVLGAAQSLLAATVLAIYRHVDLHLSLRAFQEKYPLITRGSPSFACVNEKDYLRQEQERSYIMEAAKLCDLDAISLDHKVQQPQSDLGFFVLRTLSPFPMNQDMSTIPLHVLLRAHEAQLTDMLLLVLSERLVTPDDVHTLVELLLPIACMHPHPGYRLVAFKTLSRWLVELQKESDADVFILVEDLIRTSPHIGLKAAIIGLVRELVLNDPGSRLASPLLVTDIILPDFKWSQVQESDEQDTFQWLTHESLITQYLTLLFFLLRREGPTKDALLAGGSTLEKQLLQPLRKHLELPMPPNLKDDIDVVLALERLRENLDRLDQTLTTGTTATSTLK